MKIYTLSVYKRLIKKKGYECCQYEILVLGHEKQICVNLAP